MSVLNVSLFDSHVPRELGVGYHNVGTGVLRASDTTTIDYVEAHYYQFIDEFELYGFRTPDYRVVHIADLHKEALGFLNTIEDMVKKASVPQYPLGVMLRAAESDGNYGCCLVYEQKNLVRVIPNGEVDHAAYYASWDEALTVSQKHLAASMNQQKETRVVISRYLDMADSPGMSVVIMNGQVESLG